MKVKISKIKQNREIYSEDIIPIWRESKVFEK